MNTYTIYTGQTEGPKNMRWCASFSPLDEGEATINGYGATEWDAMADLCANHDLPEKSA